MAIYKWALLLFSLSIISCGGGNSANPANTGALTFGIKWVAPGQQKPANEPGDAHYAVNCASAGVSTISVEVGNHLMGGGPVLDGGPWACSAGSGTIPAVVVGSNYTIQIFGKDSGGKTVYFGQQTGVSITAGITNDAGTITVAPVTYTDNGNGTVTAGATGLMWQKQDDGTGRTWSTAGTYCAGLALGGFSGWRLPTIDELKTLVDTSFGNPQINTTYFPGTQSSHYWSSTPYGDGTFYAWQMYFGGAGVDGFSDNTIYYYVRCVR